MAHLSLSFLGGFEATLDAEHVTEFGSDKARALLAYLSLEAFRPHRRAELAAMFWPDAPEKKAAHSLSQTLLLIRRAFRENNDPERTPFLLATRQDVQFNQFSDYQLDVAIFRELLTQSNRHIHEEAANCEVCHHWLREASDHYRGDLLAGLFVSNSAAFEEWRLVQQEELHRQALELLGRLVAYYERRGELELVIEYARRQISLEPWREEAHFQLMQAFVQSGQTADALKQYDTFQKILDEEVGLKPSAEMQRLYEQIRSEAKAALAVSQPTAGEAIWLSGQGERRQVTTLVCSRANLEDSEEQDQPIGCERYCEAIFRRFGGRRAPRRGTSCLVYFGYPKAYEDAARRAVYSGQAMAAALEGKGAARIGIHTGMILVGKGAGLRWQDRDLSGSALEVARTCQSRALPGQVLITEDTLRLVQDTFTFEELVPPLTFAAGQSVPVFLVLRENDMESRLDWLAQTQRLTDFTGRDEQLDRLERCYSNLLQGRGQTVILSGEAGIGKSRLIWEMKKLVAVPWLAARCQPQDQNTGLYPLVGLLEQLLGFNAGDSLDTRREKLTGMLAWHGLNLPATVWLLSLLLDLPVETPAPQTLTQAQREQTRQAFLALLQKSAAVQPLVIVIEDLHWSDPSTLDWLGLSLNYLANIPCLVLLTARPEFSPPWLARQDLPPGLLRLRLEPLPPQQVEAMVVGLVGDSRLEESVRRYIVNQTDGIPLFVEELTKTLLEYSQQRDGVRASAETQTGIPAGIPVTLQDSLASRLDLLGPAKETAQWAAALGREFLLPVLQACVPYDRSRLQNDLVHLFEAELISPLQATPQDIDPYLSVASKRITTPKADLPVHYAFNHILIQEAAYLSMLKRDRQAYHRQIAETLEEQFPQAAEAKPEILAEHYTGAGMPARAVNYWLLAGERAKAQGGTQEALNFFDRAIEGIKPGDNERLWRALAGREQVFDLQVERELQQRDIEALMKLAEALDDTRRAQAWLRQMRLSLVANDYPLALHAAEAARAYAGQAGNLELEMVALGGKLHTLISTGERTAAHAVAEEILARLPRISDEESRANALSEVALYFHNIGDLSRAVLLLDQAAQAARLAGNKRRESRIDINTGFTYIQLGLYSQAHAILEEGMALAEAIGERGLPTAYMSNLSYMYWCSGELEQAIALAEQALREHKVLGFSPVGQAYCLAYLGFYLEESGDLTSAIANLKEARSVFIHLGVNTDAVELQAVEARCLATLGQQEEARQLATDVWSVLREHGSEGISFPSRVYVCIADVASAIGIPGITPAEVVDAGYRDLVQRAEQISDPEWRQSFLENVVDNRTIVERENHLQAGSDLKRFS
jgi:DNA-binding SARP family transcriptional activator